MSVCLGVWASGGVETEGYDVIHEWTVSIETDLSYPNLASIFYKLQ